MKTITLSSGLALALSALLLTGCAQQPYGQNVRYEQPRAYAVRGTVERIDPVSTGPAQASGAGAVGGAVVGGLLGSQVGKGRGKTLATIAGVAAGAYGGNEAEKYYAGEQQAYRFTVRTVDGRLLTLTQPETYNLRPGDRVRVEQNRVVGDY